MFPLLVIVAGLSGTALMTAVMWFIHRSGWANADMIRAIGSLITRRYEGSLGPGLMLHVIAGCLFAIPYLLVIRSFGTTNVAAILAIGAAIGMFHGAAMIFVLMALVAETHPVEQFRSAGPDVAAAHIVGHVAYGVGVGLIAALFASKMGGATTTLILFTHSVG
jgi:uncharacterized membrane protein YagU involved in acid resistance